MIARKPEGDEPQPQDDSNSKKKQSSPEARKRGGKGGKRKPAAKKSRGRTGQKDAADAGEGHAELAEARIPAPDSAEETTEVADDTAAGAATDSAGAATAEAPGEPSDPATDESPEDDDVVRLQGEELLRCLEALLFASPEPLKRRRLYRMLRVEADKKDIDEALIRLEADLVSTGRGYQLVEDATGLRFLSRIEFAPYVARLRGEKRRIRISQAAFETLAIIAYRQPVGRADLDTIRGVQSGPIIKRLLEWGLISIVARDDDRIGRPHLYGTTKLFLEEFGLGALSDLPEPEQFLEFGEQSRLLIGLRDGETESPDEVGEILVEEEPTDAAAGIDGAPADSEASATAEGDEEVAAEGAEETVDADVGVGETPKAAAQTVNVDADNVETAEAEAEAAAVGATSGGADEVPLEDAKAAENER